MSSTPPLGSPEAPSERLASVESSKSRAKKRWLMVALGIAAVALAYGVGRVQGALALKAFEDDAAKDLRARQQRFEACESDRLLLEARRDLALVALSLDRRNFGVAETQRRRSLQTLERAAAGGVPEASGVATKVQALNLAVDPDPGAERTRVIALSETLDAILAERGSPPPPASPRP